MDEGDGGVNDALCEKRRGESGRVGSSGVARSGIGTRGFKRELRDGRGSGEGSLKDNLDGSRAGLVHSAEQEEEEKFSQFYDFDFIGRLAGRARALSLYIFRGRLSRDKGNCCILEAVSGRRKEREKRGNIVSV